MSARQLSGWLLKKAQTYAVPVVTGRANVGHCPICERTTLFVEVGPYLRQDYRCIRCDSIPRWRAIITVLDSEFPDWRNLSIHESSPSGPASRKLKRSASHYSSSQFLPGTPGGAVVGGITCQDLEALTFPDASLDLLITQDVLEHLLNPERAVAEIARVLRPGGAHVFTVPIFSGRQTLVRAIPSESGVEHLLPPDYHGNPVDPNGSLVVREWGDDLVDFISLTTGLPTEVHRLHDRHRGLDGEFLEVLITRK
jgi:SAM-dependent methyltransferase